MRAMLLLCSPAATPFRWTVARPEAEKENNQMGHLRESTMRKSSIPPQIELISQENRFHCPGMGTLLEQVKSRKRSAAESERVRLLNRLGEQVPDLQLEFLFHGLFAFGSVCRKASFRIDSDIDIAVSGCPLSAFFPLHSRLEEICGRPVDLLDLDTSRRTIEDL